MISTDSSLEKHPAELRMLWRTSGVIFASAASHNALPKWLCHGVLGTLLGILSSHEFCIHHLIIEADEVPR